jgi:hypothetical protein
MPASEVQRFDVVRLPHARHAFTVTGVHPAGHFLRITGLADDGSEVELHVQPSRIVKVAR